MDLTLALMPIKLIRSLTRPLTEKILIGILMATGLLATGVLCAKLSTYPTFGKGDPMQATVEPAMWTKLEELCGIIASCLPSLKEPGEKALRRIGVLTTRLHNTLPSFVNSHPISLQRFSKSNPTNWNSIFLTFSNAMRITLKPLTLFGLRANFCLLFRSKTRPSKIYFLLKDEL